MTRLTHLNALQALEAALRLGSMRLAAREVGITPAAVGQRIKSLEDYLGYPLIQRTKGGITSTPITYEVLGCLHSGFDQLSAVARGLKFDSPNTIHLMADTHWYECWFQPRLGRLADELPYLNVEVEIHSGAPPGTGRTADLAIEFSSPDSGGTWLFSDYLAPVATPSIYNLFYGDGGPKILEGKPLLHLDNYHTDPRALDWPAWFNMFGHRTKGFNRGIRYTSARNAIDAALGSSGALLVGLALCLNDIERNALCLLFEPDMGDWTSHAYHLQRQRESRPQVDKFVRWLEMEAEATYAGVESLVGRSNLRS